MTNLPVSVIVPSYNSRKWLSQCIDSINCGVKPAEIIIIDDCSTDDSLLFAHDLAATHANIKILKTPSNSGAAEARKVGFMAASCDLVAIVDADDLIEKNALLDAYLKISEDVDLCIWKFWRIDNNGNLSETTANPDTLPISGEKAVLLSLGRWGIHPLGVARKNLYLDAYRRFSVNSFNSDELITRILLRSARKIVGSEKKYFYRINPDSTTQKVSLKHLTVLRSNLWIINFAMDIKDAPLDILIRQSISSAYVIWKKRNLYGWAMVRAELKVFVWSLVKLKLAWVVIFRRPKFLLFFSFLILVTITGINF
jgi:glycosyltransferase involved in cell wall biosynthesis